MARRDARIALLLEMMDMAYGARGWHGTTLRGALRGVSPKQALWRAGPGRPRIWDYVLHCAYWKYAVRRRIEGEPAGAFPRRPSDWPATPDKPTVAAWRADIRLLEEEHRKLRRTVSGLLPARLDRRSAGGSWRIVQEIHGLVAHDLYHTGQLQLVKRLMR